MDSPIVEPLQTHRGCQPPSIMHVFAPIPRNEAITKSPPPPPPHLPNMTLPSYLDFPIALRKGICYTR